VYNITDQAKMELNLQTARAVLKYIQVITCVE